MYAACSCCCAGCSCHSLVVGEPTQRNMKAPSDQPAVPPVELSSAAQDSAARDSGVSVQRSRAVDGVSWALPGPASKLSSSPVWSLVRLQRSTYAVLVLSSTPLW